MSSPYLPNTDADRRAMLREIGVASVDELFQDIPEIVFARVNRLQGKYESFFFSHDLVLIFSPPFIESVLSFY